MTDILIFSEFALTVLFASLIPTAGLAYIFFVIFDR
jgi:hypothetical protein